MKLFRFLVVSTLGFTATPNYAVPVQFTLEGEPFTEWEFARRDLLVSDVVSFEVQDADGDGIASFVAEVVPQEADAAIHVKTGRAECMYVILSLSFAPASATTLPFVQDVDGDSLIVEWLGLASGTFSISQPVTVFNGTIAGLDGLVHVNPGIQTAAEMLAIDVRSLPTFTGAAEVVGLLTIQVIPEPSTVILILFAMMSVGVNCRRKRFAILRKGTPPCHAPTLSLSCS